MILKKEKKIMNDTEKKKLKTEMNDTVERKYTLKKLER